MKAWSAADCVHGIQQSTMKVIMAAGVSWRHPEADPMVEVRKCLYCKCLLPIPNAPSNDALPEVQIEIRAAFISAYSKDHEGALDDITTRECMGYVEGVNEIDTYISHYTSEEWAGWLAAQIDNEEKEAHEDPVPV